MLKRAVLAALLALNTPAFAASFEEALAAFNAGDFAGAIEQWRQLAVIGEPAAQNNLGFMYEKGLGVRADPFRAADWYRRSAEQGYLDAQVNLGVMYVTGFGVPQDLVEAHKWFDTAAQAGSKKARQDLSKVIRMMSAEEFAQARSLEDKAAATEVENEPPSPPGPVFTIAAAGREDQLQVPISQPSNNGVWRVQVASLLTHDLAVAERNRLRRQFAPLANRQLQIEEASLPKGTFYRVRVVGLAGRPAAISLCRLLRQQDQDCFVVPPA